MRPLAPEDHLTPIYPLTEGVTQGRLRMLVGMALDATGAGDIEDWLPASLLADARLPSLREALLYVHRPPADAPVELLLSGRHPAQRRLAFEELLAHQLSLKLLRQRIQSDPGWPLKSNGDLKASLLAALPFRLTKAQASGAARDRARPRAEQTHAAPGAGGCGVRQDLGGGAGGNAGRGGRPASGADGAHRTAGRPARAEFSPLVRALGRGRGAADGPADRQGAQRSARWHSRRTRSHRRRHSCAVSGERRILRARPGHRR